MKITGSNQKVRKRYDKKIFALLIALTLCTGLIACQGEAPKQSTASKTDEENTAENNTLPSQSSEGSWAVYWYLCGSDLETNGGFASADLQEMLSVSLPENVSVVIQTGGSRAWQNELMDPSKLQRWLYNKDGLTLVDEQELASMGEAETLRSFLDFANTNYPADKVAVTFWNHGGGSVSGAAFDELYENDSLDLNEMYTAFNSVWPENIKAPSLELVGFDTCLMATIDVASVFQGFAKYFVGSQELEPGNGWLYSGWLSRLAEDPSIDGRELGIAICNSYYAGCEEVGTQDQTTLSLTDLSKLTGLLDAYEAFGSEAFALAAEDPGFFADFGRAAVSTENYGGNTREQGYTNMLDLGHLARQTSWMLPSAQAVLDALEECIVYKVAGPYRSEATGLSCYYSFNADLDDLNGYAAIGTGEAFKQLYSYGIKGELLEGGDEYMASLEIESLTKTLSLKDKDWQSTPLELREDGTAYLTLGPEASDVLSSISFYLYYADEANDLFCLMGRDNDIVADWENGIFYDNFRGVWGAIDGHTVYMELSYEGDDYNLYWVPILLNGEEYNLHTAYDFTTESWSILGATQGIDENGMASKDMRLLLPGDKITTIIKGIPNDEEGEFKSYSYEELVVTENTSFGEAPLPDGSYTMIFGMYDHLGNYAASSPIMFDCIDGEIYTSVDER